MKTLLLVSFSCLSVWIQAQYNYQQDTSCYRSQYIAVSNDSVHAIFFESEDATDMLSVIYRLNRMRLLWIENATKDLSMSCCYERDYAIEETRKDTTMTPKPYYDFEMNWEVWMYGFITYFGNDEYLYDEYGEPITKKGANGEEVFVMDKDDTAYYAFPWLEELRIKEVMRYDVSWEGDGWEETEVATPIGMGVSNLAFVAKNWSDHEVLFWVDFSALKRAMKKAKMNEDDYPWVKMLEDRSFRGFRYKQVDCRNPIDRD